MAVDKLVDSTQLNSDLTSIANAIRTKGGTSAQLAFPSGFVSAIGDISPTFSQADEGKVVSNGALVAQSSQNIDTNGTYDTTLKNEVVVNVSGGGVDYLAQMLTNTITSYENEDITSISVSRAFQSVSSLQSISLPNCTSIASTAFSYCTGLKEVHLPKCVTIAGSVFEACSNALFTTIVLPAVTSLGSGAFSGASKLKTVDMLGGSISQTVFANTALDTLIMRKDSLVSLSNINAFNNSKFASGQSGGTIYIPKTLYDHLGDGTSLDYQSATNWATIYGYGTITWAKIEGSVYENAYADGTPIPTS